MFNCQTYTIADKRPAYKPLEKSLYKAWLYQKFSQKNLTTIDGQSVSIVDPGERNIFEGPDFKGAQIFIGGKLCQGDVEIHINNLDWYKHKHDADPVYNSVVLHVVIDGTAATKISTQADKAVPVLVIPAATEAGPTPVRCSSWSDLDAEGVKSCLQQYAGIRFQRKGTELKKEILRYSASHAFYRLIFDVLGYSQNRESFKTLADHLRLPDVYSILNDKPVSERIITLEALLLGTAGFLSDAYPGYLSSNPEYFQGIKKDWDKIAKKYSLSALQLNWHFAGIRPPNFPTRRLVALAQIIHKFYPDEPAQLWSNLVVTHRDFQVLLDWVNEYFQQPAGMWRNHPLFRSSPGNVLIGTGRAMDLLSNLLLPFCWTLASLRNDTGLMNKIIAWNYQVPRGEIPAFLRRWEVYKRVPVRFFTKNYLIQGAIELRHSFCDLELCRLCPLEEYAYG